MPFMSLRLISDEAKYTDYGDYESQPFNAPSGFRWVSGPLPSGAQAYRAQTLAEQLDALFMALPASVRAQFYTLKSVVKLALEASPPDIAAARLIIQGATIPSDLESARASLLAILPGGV